MTKSERDRLVELAADYSKRIGMRHKSASDARLCHEPDIAKGLLAFYQEAILRAATAPAGDDVVEKLSNWLHHGHYCGQVNTYPRTKCTCGLEDAKAAIAAYEHARKEGL